MTNQFTDYTAERMRGYCSPETRFKDKNGKIFVMVRADGTAVSGRFILLGSRDMDALTFYRNNPEFITRGCPKIQHIGEGYLHAADDDSPYDVDGVAYCGRCHRAMIGHSTPAS